MKPTILYTIPAITLWTFLFLEADSSASTTKGIIDPANPARPADAVQLVGEKGHLLVPEDPTKPSRWVFADGVLTASPVWDSLVTREPYQDFRMHLEFNVNENRESDDPEKNGNSGVYIQQRYELQILNSFGIPAEDYKHSYGGSLYRLKKPDVLANRPAGEWQSYDIVFRAARFDGGKKIANARITAYQNGKLIHDDFEIPRKTGAGKKEGPEPLPIKLQGHHNEVRFRNVWIQELDLSEKPAAPAEGQKLNVLFIAADDMNCDLGVYGHPQVKTPNLERLARMGVRFDRAYCQQPLCGPSRASLMTGLRPDTLDMHTLKHELRQKNPDVVTLGQLFKNNGYFSYRAGKIYHYGNPSSIGTDANDDPATWSERHNPAGIDKRQESEITRYGPGRGLGISMAWWDPVSEDEEHTDGMVASRAIEQIKKHRDGPFFIAAGFFNPHCPYVAPKKYFDLYPLEDITIPDLAEAKEDLADVPPMAIMRDSKNWPYYFKDITVEQARRCKQAYYACNSFVDAQVGRLLDALESEDLLDKTIIVFWSDHGYFLGEKGLWYKRKAFELSARMPMLIAAPGITRGGESSSKPVELLDLYPTLADLCGLQAPANLEGSSLRPLLQEPDSSAWTKPAVTQVWHNRNAWGYSIRTERWRYTEWLEGEAGRELYDHQTDAGETSNLAGRPEHAALVAELSARLRPYVKLSAEKRPEPK